MRAYQSENRQNAKGGCCGNYNRIGARGIEHDLSENIIHDHP
jgi:hypothetical protein